METDYTSHWIDFVKYFRKTGMSIKDIQTYKESVDKGDSTLSQRIEILQKQRERVLKNITDEQEQIALISHKLEKFKSDYRKYL